MGGLVAGLALFAVGVVVGALLVFCGVLRLLGGVDDEELAATENAQATGNTQGVKTGKQRENRRRRSEVFPARTADLY